GPKASLDTTLKASLDRAGIASATATASFKALAGNTTIDTTGTGLTIRNNKLTDAQFKAAVETTFGPHAKLSNKGTFEWKPDSGVSAELVSAFKDTWGNVDSDLKLKNGKVSATVAEKIKTTLGDNTLLTDNQVV